MGIKSEKPLAPFTHEVKAARVSRARPGPRLLLTAGNEPWQLPGTQDICRLSPV